MRNCKNRILCLLLCSMMLSTLMPISVIASELKVSEGIAASVSGVEEEVPPHDEAEPEPEPSEDLPPLIEGEEEVSPDEEDEAKPELEPSEDLPPLIQGDEGVSPDEAGAEPSEDMTLVMEAAAPAVTGGALLTDWEHREEADRIILDKYIGRPRDVIVPGVFDGKSGKSVVINGSKEDFLPEDTKTLKVGDADNRVALTVHNGNWWSRNLVEADLRGLHQDFIDINMFQGMTRLARVNVAGWDVSRVPRFRSVFEGCTSLQSVDLSTWDVSAATLFSSMFEGCASLRSIDLSSWADKMANAEDLTRMFQGCTSLEEVNLSDWKLPNVTDMGHFVRDCTSLRELDLSGWDVSGMKYFNNVFEGCTSLQSVDLSSWDVSAATSFSSMFKGCTSLTSIDLSSWADKMANVGALTRMFDGCTSLEEANLSGWKLPKITHMGFFVSGCTSLRELDLSSWRLGPIRDNAYGMFYGASSLEDLNLAGWDVSKLRNMRSMFRDCHSLKKLDLTDWNPASNRSFSQMFQGCSSLIELDLSKWDISNATSLNNMFDGMSSLETLKLGDWKTSNVTDMTDMFAFCDNLQLFDLSSFIVDPAAKIEGMFRLDGSAAVPTFIVSNDERIKTAYADRIEGRVYGGPFWDANGGELSSGKPKETWGDKFVFPDKSGLITTDVAVFNKYTATKVGDTFHGWFLDAEGTQEFKPDPAAPQTFDLMSDPKYVNMTLYASWKLPKSRITGHVKTEANRTITASLKRGDAVINTAAAIQGKFVMEGVEAGVYTLELSAPSALTRRMEITVVAGINLEVATADNPLTLVYGDANEDGIIDALDLGLIKTWFGKVTGDADYTEYIDINVDGIVDALDLGHVKTWFGSTSGS